MSTNQAINRSKLLMGLAGLVLLPVWAGAVVVTDNNLQSTSLPDLSNTPYTTVSNSNFATVTNQLVAVQLNITNTYANSPANVYYIDRLAPGGGADVVNWGGGIPPGYSATHTLGYSVSGTTSLSLMLNEGSFGFNEYAWSATNIKLFQPAGADAGLITTNGISFGGNLVPNASFENPTLNFFGGGGGGGSIVADAGAKQGSYDYQNSSTLDNYIQLPVVPGRQYAYSFWYKVVAGNNYGELDYGPSAPGFSIALGAGNSGGFTPGTVAWTEVTGLFTALPTQTSFYIGGLANGGYIAFDSIYLAVPEPSTVFLLLTGGWLLVWQRRRSAHC